MSKKSQQKKDTPWRHSFAELFFWGALDAFIGVSEKGDFVPLGFDVGLEDELKPLAFRVGEGA